MAYTCFCHVSELPQLNTGSCKLVSQVVMVDKIQGNTAHMVISYRLARIDDMSSASPSFSYTQMKVVFGDNIWEDTSHMGIFFRTAEGGW